MALRELLLLFLQVRLSYPKLKNGRPALLPRQHLGIPPELLPPVEVNLRVVLTWDADNTDIDLWVIDPIGEAVYYSQPRSKSGGHISRDFTGGYGPEAFTIARPLPGTYRIQAQDAVSSAQAEAFRKLTGQAHPAAVDR